MKGWRILLTCLVAAIAAGSVAGSASAQDQGPDAVAGAQQEPQAELDQQEQQEQQEQQDPQATQDPATEPAESTVLTEESTPTTREAGQDDAPGNVCRYRLFNWNAKRRTTEADRPVVKPYADVTAAERDPLEPRCSLCQSDQVLIEPASLGLKGVKPFRVCHVYADRVREVLRRVAKSGTFEIREVIGYRPGRTRGAIINGRRSELSNHSFGTAIDINPGYNGLYKDCTTEEFAKANHGKCKLSIGGAWNPQKSPRVTVTKQSRIYRELTRFWKWGGEIPGGTRDLMHFSISGF